MQLRPYQQKADDDIVAAWASGKKRVFLQLPTGGGKTVMFNHRAAVAARKGKRVLIIADRRELIQQAWSRLWQAANIHAGIILSGHPQNHALPIQIASIQTLNRRTFPPNIDMVIIDEARGSVADSYKTVFGHYKDAYFLGVDATPIRTTGQGFDHLYNHMVIGPTIKELEALGSLVPARPFVNPLDQRILDRVKITAGDYNEKQLAEVMSDKTLTADLVQSKLKHAPGLKTIVFAVSIAHSKMIIEQYNAAGIKAMHVDGEMAMEERASIFKRFKNGDFEVLCNVGIACYGFDEPSIQCVQLARPTKSLALYLQQVGRGTRPYTLPTGEKKEKYILLDHANCVMEFGMPNSERRWQLKGRKKEAQRPRQFKIKMDGEEKIVTAKDYPQGVEGLELQEIDELTLRMAEFKKIMDHATAKGYKPLSCVFRYTDKFPDAGADELKQIEKLLNFKQGWWRYKLKDLEENRNKKAQTA